MWVRRRMERIEEGRERVWRKKSTIASQEIPPSLIVVSAYYASHPISTARYHRVESTDKSIIPLQSR